MLSTTTSRRAAACLTGSLLLCAGARAQGPGTNGITEIASLDSTGSFGAKKAEYPALSEDGRYVAFETSSQLLPEDTDNHVSIYVLDRQTGVLTHASTSLAGVAANGNCHRCDLSADGRWVVFHTTASNLVQLDANNTSDVYRKDLWTGAVDRVSNAWLSPSAGNAGSSFPSISDDGQRIAFESHASDLVIGDTNGRGDIFLMDMQTGVMQRITDAFIGETNGHSWGAEISGDGTHVAYTSAATNVVLYDLNGADDVFLVEVGFVAKLVSFDLGGSSADGNSGAASLSYDGSRVAYHSNASDIVAVDTNPGSDVFLYDGATLTNELVSLTSGGTQIVESVHGAALSRDGRVVGFETLGELAASGLWVDVFVRDLDAGRTWTVSRPSGTTLHGDQSSYGIDLAQGGAVAAFASWATNLVPGDTNTEPDVFVRTLHPDPLEYCSVAATSAGCQPRLQPAGFSSVSGATFLSLVGSELPNQKTGILFYGLEGQSSNPWGGSTMCVAGQKKRTPLITTAGNIAGDDCTGFFAFDMNAYAAGLLGGSPKPELSIVGQVVDAQFWGRDPLLPSGTFLSTAVEYVVGP